MSGVSEAAKALGRARWAKRTKAQRSAHGRMMALKRWKKIKKQKQSKTS